MKKRKMTDEEKQEQDAKWENFVKRQTPLRFRVRKCQKCGARPGDFCVSGRRLTLPHLCRIAATSPSEHAGIIQRLMGVLEGSYTYGRLRTRNPDGRPE